MRNIYKLIVTLCAVLMLAACSREGSSGVQDGTRWQSDAVQLVSYVQDAPNPQRIIIDFNAPAWKYDAPLVQIAGDGTRRNVVVDTVSKMILVNYTLMCNFDGKGGGGKCVQETVRPYTVGQSYRFEKQAPAVTVTPLGGAVFAIEIPVGWECPICAVRNTEAQ